MLFLCMIEIIYIQITIDEEELVLTIKDQFLLLK